MQPDLIQDVAGIRAAEWRPFGLSLAIHVVILVAIALLWTTRSIGGGTEEPLRRVDIVLATADEQPEYLEQRDLEPTPAEPGTAAPASLAEALPESDKPPVDTSALLAQEAPLDVPLPGLDSAEMARPDARASSPRTAHFTPEELEALAAERAAFAARAPKGPPTTLNVFGSGNLTGRKFVFCIDRSRSMGSQGLDVLNAAADELARAVDALEPHHEFQIVAYHHQTATIGSRQLMAAGGEARELVREFILNLASFGGTEHEGALVTALSMDPDVVLLLTDGGLPPLNEAQMRRIHRTAGGTQIHCVQFGSGPLQDPDPFMKRLAEQNSGTWRYVNVHELNNHNP